MKFAIITSISLLLMSCSSLERHDSKEPLSLSKILNISPNKDDQDSVLKALGPADIILPLPKSEDTAWIFKSKKTGYQKLSLVFDNQKKVQSVLWLISENDPEINLENSKKHFPDAIFVVEDATWENPHAAPNEKYYVDNKKGISITVRKSRQQVESISWYNPSNINNTSDRQPAFKYEL